jgi:hypothetical protein
MPCDGPHAFRPDRSWLGAVIAVALITGACPPVNAAPAALPAADAAHAMHADATAPAASGSARRTRHSPYTGAQHLSHADVDYELQWGVDSMQAHQTNAGNLIRFSYRVVDTNKAKALIDKAAAPLMISPKAGVALQVPVMDKVGALRQSTELVSGKTYWMVFSNKGNLVRPGDHVSVVVGRFRVDGLVVQ